MSDTFELDRVVREIEDEVAARRASGDFPPGLERELDLVFARFAPPAASGDDLDAVLAAADRASFVDVDVPTASNIPGLAPFKRGLRKMMEWYLRYLAQQVSELATSWAAALKLLAGRVKALEAATATADPVLDEVRRRAEPARVTPFEDGVATLLAGTRGRVLVTECGDGGFLRRLVADGADVYGVDPDADRVEAAIEAGSEARVGEALEHLRAVAEGALDGLVLCGCVDRLALAHQLELADLAAGALANGGRMAVVGTSPAAWAQAVDVVSADLAPGRPLHADTWVALLERRGFTDLVRHDGPSLGALETVEGESADVLNANLARISEALFGPASFAVTCVRHR
ncbi:hypothetical protein BH24ACT2_BH24ACT2_09490 [soil metagenome]